jgi:hypothetical protein
MAFSINMGEAIPGTEVIESVLGQTEDFKRFFLNLETATPEQQKICSNFLALVGGHATVSIINSAHNFNDVTFIAAGTVELDVVEVDYDLLNSTNKGKINTFANLLISLTEN